MEREGVPGGSDARPDGNSGNRWQPQNALSGSCTVPVAALLRSTSAVAAHSLPPVAPHAPQNTLEAEITELFACSFEAFIRRKLRLRVFHSVRTTFFVPVPRSRYRSKFGANKITCARVCFWSLHYANSFPFKHERWQEAH